MATEELRKIRARADRLLRVMVAAIVAISFCSIFSLVDPATLNAVAIGAATILLPAAYFMRDLDRGAKRLLKRFLAHPQTAYIVVANPLAIISACVALLMRRISLVAIALPIPRIPDINLSPRLLPVPRALMGAV